MNSVGQVSSQKLGNQIQNT